MPIKLFGSVETQSVCNVIALNMKRKDAISAEKQGRDRQTEMVLNIAARYIVGKIVATISITFANSAAMDRG